MEANCDFMETPISTERLGWTAYAGAGSPMKERDSMEFLESAFSKWKLYYARGRCASSEGDLVELIRADSGADILGILSIEDSFSGIGESLGICQFRRTWSHNIAIDFVAVHPLLLRPSSPISGVGTALLYCVAGIAHRIRAEKVWLETTDLSVNYYSRLFGTSNTSDLLVLPTEAFYGILKARFEGTSFA